MNSKRTVYAGSIPIGGKHPIVIQSMVNTRIDDRQGTIRQIRQLSEAGCMLVRIAYPSDIYRDDLAYIIKHSPLPVIADIHFDYKLAIGAIEAGAAKIRINPGNIGKKHIPAIAEAAAKANIPIRIGVNSGSLESELIEKYGHPVPEALVESAVKSVELFEKEGFHSIVLSIKSSDVLFMYNANIMLSKATDYPIHLGVTEAGGLMRGAVKSSAGIASLLLQNIGDTVRVSLSADPVEEIGIAKMILKSLHMYSNAPDIISCPTCSRSTFDVIGVQDEVEQLLSGTRKDITVAVMGCVVNGPGEAREADFGITGTEHQCILFKKGEIIFKGSRDTVLEQLAREVKHYEKDTDHTENTEKQ